MVAAEDDRHRAGRGDLEHLAEDHRVAALERGGNDVRVAGIDDVEHLERLDAELQRVAALVVASPGGWLAARTALPAGR